VHGAILRGRGAAVERFQDRRCTVIQGCALPGDQALAGFGLGSPRTGPNRMPTPGP
jgi:hypothetical protein